MEVYKKVRTYIEKNGYERATVAIMSGIPQIMFNKMMDGRTKMYADDLRAICLALNVSPELFIEL